MALPERWRLRPRAWPEPAPEPAHFAYSRWDGTQAGLDLDADHLFNEMADDLLYHGDLASALRRLMADGFSDRSGRRLAGLRELLERLLERRRELLGQHGLGGVFDDVAEALRGAVSTEREALDDLARRAEEARAAGDHRRADLAAQTAAAKSAQLDMVPPDLAGQFKTLDDYEFESDEARRRFEDLAARLREQLMQQFLDRLTAPPGDCASTSATGDGAPAPADANSETERLGEMERLKDMLAELNDMLVQRARGREPDFGGFMERHGDFFPESPKTLDELLEVMARRMAAAQSLLNSMTPAQRDQLQRLFDQLLADIDLDWQVSELARHLRRAFPQFGWDRSHDFGGFDPLDFGEAVDMLAQLGDMDRLESLLRGGPTPAALAEADTEAAGRLLGDDAAQSLEAMAELAAVLEEAGLTENRQGRLVLTPRAVRKIGQGALRDLFAGMGAEAGKVGRHALHRPGPGHERTDDTKPHTYGDPFNLHIARTVHNAVARSGGGVPVELRPDDFEVERTEHQVRSSTVLMLDLSLSMPMRNNFLPAKKVAMALHALISTQYPRDYLGLVSFSEVARELRPEKLPEVSWDYVHGTNMQHGLMLARRMLGRQTGARQIVMITDGEPTAHITASGRPLFSYPPARETVDATLAEVARCTRDGIRINTFMLDGTSRLTDFVERITRLNGGRAFLTTKENLGGYVLVDFVEHKRSLTKPHR